MTSPEGDPTAVYIVCYSGPLDKGEEVIRPLRELGSPVADMVAPMPYTAIQALGGDLYPAGRLNYWRSSFIGELSDDAIDVMIAQVSNVPSPFSLVGVEHLGGAVSRIGKEETAFGERSADYSLIITSVWVDPADSGKNVQWARDYWEAMQPFARESVYVNYLERDEADRVSAAYGTDTHERLVALKNKYDPTNLFQVNQNIKPNA